MTDFIRDFNSQKYDENLTPDGCNGRPYPYNNVAGETSKTNYRMRIVSDEISSIIKLNFNDNRGFSRHVSVIDGQTSQSNLYGDFNQDYDPDIDKLNNIGFTGLTGNERNKFKVLQVNNLNGNILADGFSIRWIPNKNESQLYIEQSDNNNPFKSYEENGGVFIQNYDGLGSMVSWGSSIDSINLIENVYAIQTYEIENSTEEQQCFSGSPSSGYGDVPATGIGFTPIHIMFKDRIENPNFTDPCDQYSYSGSETIVGDGILFMKLAGGSGLVLYVMLNEDIDDITNFAEREYFIQSQDLTGQGLPCFRYTISDTTKLQKVKQVRFKENAGVAGENQYELGTGTGGITHKVYQWNAKNLLSGIPATKIEADLLTWIPSESLIIVQECTEEEFSIGNGAIIQNQTNAIFGNKGLNISKSEFEPLNNVRFVNLVKQIQTAVTIQDQSILYNQSKQYIANWNNTEGGEKLLQTHSKDNSYDSNYNYFPGSKVIQVHKLNTSNEIEDYQYAYGTVLSWEYPDPTNPSDNSHMKLLVRTHKKGPRTPDSDLGVDDYSDLQTFKIGSYVYDTDNPLQFDGKILPYSSSSFINQSVFNSWPYDVDNPTQSYFTSDKNGYFIDDIENYSVKSELPIPSVIGNTRIRCISLNPTIDFTETYPLYKFYIFDSNLYGSETLFGYLSHIGYKYELDDNSNVTKLLIKIAEISGKESYLDSIDGSNLIESKRTVIFNPDKDKMFIDIENPVENSPFENVLISNLTFEIQKIYNVNFDGSATQLSIPVESGSSSVTSNAQFILNEPNINWFVINRKTGDTFDLYPDTKSNQQPNELIYKTSNDQTYNSNKLELTRSLSQDNNELLVIAKVSTTVNNNNIKNKSLTNQTELLISKLNKELAGKYKNKFTINLMEDTPKKGLLVNINSIYIVSSNNSIVPGTKNIKNLFDIDYGVSDQIISYPKLILKPGNTTSNGKLKSESFGSSENEEIEPSSVNLQISYSMYEIQETPSIFTRESFKFGSVTQSLDNIPFYTSPNSGEIYHYSRLLDFRPSGLFDSSGKTLGNTKFVPHPDWSDSIETTFYLPRKDRLILTKNGTMEVVYGIPSTNPSFPQEPKSSMSLYLLNKPAYVFSNKDVQLIQLDNKRYTMKDIGNIDKRVKKLEYYTSLSLLEADADSLLILDENGNNRFKSGILVDSFTGHGIGDVLHPDYNISIDNKENCARPPFIIHNSKLEYDSTEQISNIFVESKKPGTTNINTGIYTFPFTIEPFAAQPLASRSISVMPHEVVDWVGELSPFPSSDIWVDETRNPDVIVNIAGDNDAWQALASTVANSGQGPWGMHWNNWQTIGQTTNTNIVVEQINQRRRTGSITSQITTTSNIEQRNGIFNELIATETTNSLGTRITDIEIVPFMREQEILLVASGLKTNTRMYVFFDDIDVSEHCFNYANEQDLLNNSNGFSFATSSPSNLKTTDNGQMFIRFNLPSSTFRTGEKVFQVIDHSGNDRKRASTYASTKYYSNGLGIVREETLLTTRDFQTITRNVTEERSIQVSSETIVLQDNTRSRDPLAQTFFVNEELHPEGIFIKSVELFFSRKPTNNPNLSVSVELRPTNNGYPDSIKTYPGGISRKIASEINVSDNPDANDPSTKTIFEFDYPIHLAPGEHSLVIKGQSEDFEVYVAELGENILNTEVQITNQPYEGVFFTSANASTWSAEQNIDLMMVLNKCSFATNVEYILPLVNNNIEEERLFETLFIQSNYIDFNSCRSFCYATLIPSSGGNADLSFEVQTNINVYLEKQYLYGRRNNGESLPAKFAITAKTTNPDVCPIFDMDRLGFLAINNRIESNDSIDNGELLPYAEYPTGIPRARYISRIVTLEDGFESNNCKVILTLNKPKNTNIQVFGKFQSAYETGEFHNRSYIEMIPQNQPVFDSYQSAGNNDWREFTFDLPSETSEPFNKFCIKICLYSDDPVYVPKIKNMRGITVI